MIYFAAVLVGMVVESIPDLVSRSLGSAEDEPQD